MPAYILRPGDKKPEPYQANAIESDVYQDIQCFIYRDALLDLAGWEAVGRIA